MLLLKSKVKMQLQKLLEAVAPGKISILNNSNPAHGNVVQSVERPNLIVHPTSTAEVSHILHALHPLLEQNQVSIAVQNATLSPLVDDFNRTHSVTIDLRRLEGMSLNEDKSLVTIGAGETWASVQGELRTWGLEVGGGNINHSLHCKY
jgi:FAD/FMN-containing dehydrogenase